MFTAFHSKDKFINEQQILVPSYLHDNLLLNVKKGQGLSTFFMGAKVESTLFGLIIQATGFITMIIPGD